MLDTKKCFTALKKCNEIGKKLTDESIYVLINGMIMGYHEVTKHEDNEAYGFSVSFIDEKIVNDLDALAYIPLKIDGTELYRLNKDYKFERFEIGKKYVHIIFSGMHTDDSSFYTEFTSVALDKGFTQNQINDGIASNFENDIDLYELYLKYKKTFKPKESHTEFDLKCKIISEDDRILKKAKSIKHNLKQYDEVSRKDIEDEIYTRIIESDKPVLMKFKTDNKKYKLRLMKSLFKTCVKSSKSYISILDNDENDNIFYSLIHVINKGFDTVNIYKCINY